MTRRPVAQELHTITMNDGSQITSISTVALQLIAARQRAMPFV
jgi:hypothetical protein